MAEERVLRDQGFLENDRNSSSKKASGGRLWQDNIEVLDEKKREKFKKCARDKNGRLGGAVQNTAAGWKGRWSSRAHPEEGWTRGMGKATKNRRGGRHYRRRGENGGVAEERRDHTQQWVTLSSGKRPEGHYKHVTERRGVALQRTGGWGVG